MTAFYKLGKLSPRCPVGLKDMADYVEDLLAPPPASVDHYSGVTYQMSGNDTVGDCTLAAVVNADLTWEKVAGVQEPIPSAPAVEAVYFHLSGGQDSGLVEANVLQTYATQGLFGRKILGYAPIHPQHTDALKNCIDLLGLAYVGVQLPQSAEQQFADGQAWSVVAGSPIIGGHAIVLTGYDQHFLYAATWGRLQRLTLDWWLRFGDEAWGILPSEYAHLAKLPLLRRDLPALEAA